MRHTTKIEIANLKDMFLAEAGIIPQEDVRQLTVEDVLVDTGATRLSLPKPLIDQLGLAPVGNARTMTANGIASRTIYSAVEFTVMERKGNIQVTDLPANAPVLVGHIILEMLDLCVDIRKGLIYNPAHDNEWIEEQL
ncbi:aspartyl protease [Candidatus Poribacteria bacterium]|nr:aspartyl protease [Candidatus Poribacteria bacterium]MYG06636.1 aspartyl protease [Candidatus Poribacteria bacterium]MYK19686.1 aspartyl protease [Candidatus Poribacteria bacterium]